MTTGEIIVYTLLAVFFVFFAFVSCTAYNTCVAEHKERGFSHVTATQACRAS